MPSDPDRPSILPTLVILAGLAVIGAPAIFAGALLGTRQIDLTIFITLGVCLLTPLVFAGVIIGLGILSQRRLQRFAMSKCMRCGYDLRGTDGTICPECGLRQRFRHE